jgi:hypothetical protein
MPITPLYANNAEKPGKPIFNEFITPIGRVVHCYHDKPQLQETDSKPPRPVMDENGIQKADFKVTLAWPKAMLTTELMPMRTLAGLTRDQAWGPDAATDPWLNLQPFLRDGDNPEHNTKRKEYLFGHVYLNFKSKAAATRHPDGRVTYSGAPGLIGPYNEDLLPSDMYAGAMARISGIMFGTEYSGKRFISTRLNNIQKAADGERMGGGGKPDAKSQFDPLQAPAAPGGFGTTLVL